MIKHTEKGKLSPGLLEGYSSLKLGETLLHMLLVSYKMTRLNLFPIEYEVDKITNNLNPSLNPQVIGFGKPANGRGSGGGWGLGLPILNLYCKRETQLQINLQSEFGNPTMLPQL